MPHVPPRGGNPIGRAVRMTHRDACRAALTLAALVMFAPIAPAAGVSILGTWHIVFREMVPNMMTYIVISFSLALTGAIYTQVGLVFLGLVPFSSNNWGQMIAYGWTRGAIFFEGSIWYIMSPIIAIALFQLAVISMTRSLEMVFNPRLRTNE